MFRRGDGYSLRYQILGSRWIRPAFELPVSDRTHSGPEGVQTGSQTSGEEREGGSSALLCTGGRDVGVRWLATMILLYTSSVLLKMVATSIVLINNNSFCTHWLLLAAMISSIPSQASLAFLPGANH